MPWEPGIRFGAQHAISWELGYLSSTHRSLPRAGKVQLASLWNPLPLNSYEQSYSSRINLRWMLHP